MTDKQLKNKLLTELVRKKELSSKILMDIFENNQSKLNLIAKEFKIRSLAQTTKSDQNGVIQINITRRTKTFFDNGGF